MKRTISLIVATAIAGIAFSGTAIATARLKTSAVVDGTTIRLGDVMEGAGAASKAIVSEAPEPGKRQVIRVAMIKAIAEKHGVKWQETAIRSLPVSRASHIVPQEVLMLSIKDAIVAQGVSEEIAVALLNTSIRLYVPRGSDVSVAVDDIQYNKERGTFNAMVRSPADDKDGVRKEIRGRVYAVMDVPVLNHRIPVGQKITEGDVTWTEMRVDRAGRNLVTNIAEIVGKAPKRNLRPNRPLRTTDLRRPIVIAKGASVTMVVSIPGMTLSVTGRALEDGGRGDTIGIMNPQTHSVVEGVVVSPTRVDVRMRQNTLASLN
ncbi:MAG: flagellar basal body P-ring formation protein FlgA [Alphaproteobacteria bacterium]|jgi:flagellar basal body P-ring formation protein FlgA|nr:flagellar basal body P-ring formation protein FlgA [Alphaproteobacteria bacterium]MBT4084343.1 flagellar basal body P-ring formation protein FlgA [Alphaproteobacteria bacterium]MBT4542757.1 flagellar basal body P-ring formation protein FlgA [Alphaproteobacteria bacterium]MBT7743674.1 flagellar basal body P-ring formation protein FlgA [Alphaproteobacteria bacterium]